VARAAPAQAVRHHPFNPKALAVKPQGERMNQPDITASKPLTSIKLEVRDHECDLGGGVNNGVYSNYIEHARHKYIKLIGVDFAEYAKKKISLVVLRLEMDFRHSLVSGDEFVVLTAMEPISRVRFQFNQQIRRVPDDKLVLDAKVIGTAVNESGRPFLPAEIEAVLSGAAEPAQ
jgi:acyl-CoA thioester hydrolase